MARAVDKDRAQKTLYVTGFHPKFTTKHLLEELFTQGGPVRDVTLFDTHAYILFQHEESVPYCLALFNETELHGHKLRINPRVKGKEAYCYMKYLEAVRKKLLNEYMKIPPPNLPEKKTPDKKRNRKGERENFKSHNKGKKSSNRNTSSGSSSRRKNRRGLSSSNPFSTANAASQLTGLPPNVLKYSVPLILNGLATSVVVTLAESGKQFPIGLPIVTMSGLISSPSN